MTGCRASADPLDSQSVLLRVLADRLPAMLAYWDSTLHCRFANRAYEKWFGVSPESMIGRRMDEFLGPLFALNLPYIQAALRGEEQEFEREIPDPAGGRARHSQAHYLPDVQDGRVRGFCVLVVDITRRKRAEEALQLAEVRLRAVERLTAMATLAAGIGHEINNPLTSVVGNLELALENLAPLTHGGSAEGAKAPLQRCVEQLNTARESAQHIAEIVQSMKLLARGETSSRGASDVDETLRRSLTLAGNALRYRARVELDLRARAFVEANASQLTQVFVNLLVNAAQALPDGSLEQNLIAVRSFREGAQVVVEVIDNGRGIPEPLHTRIFEPFFTTKDVGGGVGLGLSISRSIVAAHGGTLSLRSTEGAGSTFRVELPATQVPAPREPARLLAEANAPARSERAQRYSVLVVDDEPALRTLATFALRDLCEVRCTGSVAEALAALSACEGGVDTILCDLMMPGGSGAQLYAEAVARWPRLSQRFVFTTGGAFTDEGRAFLASVNAPLLEKPFSIEQLRSLLRSRIAG